MLPLTPRRRRRMPAIQSTPHPGFPCRPHHNHRTSRLNAISPHRLQVATVRVDSGLCTMRRFLKASGQPAPAGTTFVTSGRSWTAAPQLAAPRCTRPSRELFATMLHPCVQTLQQLELDLPYRLQRQRLAISGGVRGSALERDAASCRRIVIGAPPSARSVVQICFIRGSRPWTSQPPAKSFCFVSFRSVFVMESG